MRGKQSKKRKIDPDAKHGSVMVSSFINRIMQHGKRDLAREIVYEAMDKLKSETKAKTALDAFKQAFKNASPPVEVRSRRVGGSNYQVPVPVREDRQFALASRWIIDAARSGRGSRKFADALASELIAAYNNEGAAIRKKQEVKRMAEANKAFAQFA